MKFSYLIAFSLLLLIGCGGESDPCAEVNCGMNGTCNTDTGACDCKLYFEGSDCDLLSRTKFIGTWAGTGTCSLNPTNTMNLSLNITEEQRIGAVILQSGGLFQGLKVTGLMDSMNNVNIALFKPFAGANDHDGNVISIDTSNIELNLFVYENDMVINSCNYKLSK